MPSLFTWGKAVIVKRPGGDSAIPDSYLFDLNSDFHILSAELTNGDPNEVTLKLRLDLAGIFLTSGPILINEAAKWNYLIECYLVTNKTNGKLFRCRIKNAVKILNDKYGLLLQVSCEGLEIRLSETPVSNPQILKTPEYAMTSYMIDYNKIADANKHQEKLLGYGGLFRGHVIHHLAPSTVQLNDSASLRQDWIPGGVVTYYDMFDTIIQRLSLSQPQGGSNKEYYMDYDYIANNKRLMRVTAKEFAAVDSGIVIDPISFDSPENESTEIIDNTKYHDKVILECDSIAGSLPMDRTRILSALEHGRKRDEYDHTKTYGKDDVVKWTDRGLKRVRFYKSLKDNNTTVIPLGSTPTQNAGWTEDVYRSNVISPLTNNLEIWKANISAFKNSELGSGFSDTSTAVTATTGYIGGFPDPNFVRVNYDRGDLGFYETITLKDVTRVITGNSGIPTGAEVYDGKRILVGLDKNVSVTTAPFSANKQKIAEYDAENQTWQFSKSPEDGDVISDHATLKLFKYVGTYPNGKWTIFWQTGNATWTTSPWHPLKSMKLVDDSNGVKNAAVELYYDWNTNPLTGGTYTNAVSRGWWFAFYHPTPRFHISSKYPIGKIFKHPFIDLDNMRYSADGTVGYNDIRGEDHGPIAGIRVTLTSSIQDSNDKNLNYKAEQKIIFWVIDNHSRITYKPETIRSNGHPETFILAYGGSGENELWVNRLDDLKEVYGFTIPALFGLPQEERAGVTFDWSHIRGFGCFLAEPYSDNPKYYTGGADSYVEDLAGRLQTAWELFLHSASSLFAASPTPPAIVLADHARLKIEDLHYIKQLIVMSDDNAIDNPHVKIEQDSNETDYTNAKITASALAAKGKVFRPVRHITSDLDVRLQKGMRFSTSDGREWGVISVKQIIDDDGATMEIAATPRLVLT